MEELNDADFPPVIKNPSGKFIDLQQKVMIINLYESKMFKQANNPEKLKYIDLIKLMSKEIGIGQRTISTTLSEYRRKGTVSSPNRKKVRLTSKEKIDYFDQKAIRKKIHEFWLRREIPTIRKMLTAINDDPNFPNLKIKAFQSVLKDLNFPHTYINQNSALIERSDIICWRQKYIEEIRYHRSCGRPIYYLTETWINADETIANTWVDNMVTSHREEFLRGLTTPRRKTPSCKDKQLIFIHIGSSDGFVDGGLFIIKPEKNSVECHEGLNSDTFYNWFCGILPLLKKNAIIVMDNAPHHSVKQEFPLSSWKKEKIIEWLEVKGKIFDRPMVKSRLLEEAEQFRPLYDKYIIDELAKNDNKIVLRLPPYHCELNPIELVLASVKHQVGINNKTFELSEVKTLLIEGIERVTPEIWKNYINHCIKKEDKFYKIDFISDELLDAQHLKTTASHQKITVNGNAFNLKPEPDNELL